jgi:hypothetical protein
MKWSELKSLIENKMESESLADPHIAVVDLDYYVREGITTRTPEISMRETIESKETYTAFGKSILTRDTQ